MLVVSHEGFGAGSYYFRQGFDVGAVFYGVRDKEMTQVVWSQPAGDSGPFQGSFPRRLKFFDGLSTIMYYMALFFVFFVPYFHVLQQVFVQRNISGNRAALVCGHYADGLIFPVYVQPVES